MEVSSCTYISTRNWNIKSHINRKHSGYGRPLPLLAGKETDHFQARNFTPYSGKSVRNLYLKEESILKSLIDQKDHREILLYDILEQISPQFREMEQLLTSLKSDFGTMQSILASAIICAISSQNPTASMNESLKTCHFFGTSTKMINFVAYFLNISPAWAKIILKRFLPAGTGQDDS